MAYGLREYGPRGRLKYGGAWGHLAGLSCALMSVVRQSSLVPRYYVE